MAEYMFYKFDSVEDALIGANTACMDFRLAAMTGHIYGWPAGRTIVGPCDCVAALAAGLMRCMMASVVLNRGRWEEVERLGDLDLNVMASAERQALSVRS